MKNSGMKNSKFILFVGLGIAFWYQAAMIIKFFGTTVFTEHNPKLVMFFLLAIPITIASMYITALLTSLKIYELLKPVVIMTFTATFLDGIALVWFRHLYSESFEVALNGAAWILWGAGLGLLFAYLGGNKSVADSLNYFKLFFLNMKIKKAKYLIYILLFQSCLPKAPNYPQFNNVAINQEAKQLSDSLENYIKLWYIGQASEILPKSVLPLGYDYTKYKNIRLVKYDNIDPKKEWVFRPAHKIDFQKLYGSFPDPNCSYLLAPVLYAPFGSTLHIEGSYPYCRFFSIQVSPTFDPSEYRFDKWSGKGEISIVDADIKPQKGNLNPFLPNADRLIKNRNYEVTFEMAIGNPSALNPSHKFPYRVNQNILYASGIQFQGPWGLDTKSGHGRGLFDFGDVWIRYYAIDKNQNEMAGTALPKLYFELKTGEKFFIIADYDGLIKASETTMANRNKGNSDPAPYNGFDKGWDKQFGIFLQISTGAAHALYKEKPSDKEYIRKLDLGVNGRGENQPKPASFEPHATGSNYTGYLTTGTSIKKDNVFVITGKLPTFPDTRNNAKIFEKAQCRYWSLTTYDSEFPFSDVKGLENTCVMDDEIVINEKREYIIVYSRKEDRPKNATKENGVTWIDWGYTCTQAITLRWISVSPEWSFEYAPNEINLPWSKSTWSGTEFDKNLIGSNTSGFLKEFHPIKHYMKKNDFENLGNNLTISKMPIWK
jgi:hypothetical protein